MVPAHRCVGETALIDFLFSHEQLLADTWGRYHKRKGLHMFGVMI